MNYQTGQQVNVERIAIYAHNNGTKSQESVKTIADVKEVSHGTLVKFENSKIWFSANGEYFDSRRIKYRNLDWNA